MEIFDLKDKQEFMYEVMELELLEWSDEVVDKEDRISKKIDKYNKFVNENNFCKLILVDENSLIGFISLFPFDVSKVSIPSVTETYLTLFSGNHFSIYSPVSM